MLSVVRVTAPKGGRVLTHRDYLGSLLALGLDREDPVVLTRTVYKRSYRILSLDPESIGLAKADRRELKEIIDGVLVSGAPESERKRIEMDAGIIDMDIQEIMENESQEAD